MSTQRTQTRGERGQKWKSRESNGVLGGWLETMLRWSLSVIYTPKSKVGRIIAQRMLSYVRVAWFGCRTKSHRERALNTIQCQFHATRGTRAIAKSERLSVINNFFLCCHQKRSLDIHFSLALDAAPKIRLHEIMISSSQRWIVVATESRMVASGNTHTGHTVQTA